MLVLSCALAVGVNISQFKCLGRFTAGSFQVGCRAAAAKHAATRAALRLQLVCGLLMREPWARSRASS